jgi:hypothetical protein
LLLGLGGQMTKFHPPCAPSEEEGSENHRSEPGVNVPAEGNADGYVVGCEGAIAAWSRGTK